jgi:hypothetical protein
MTQAQILIAEILLSVARGQRTVDQLKRTLADGLAYVKAVGVKNVEINLLMVLAAISDAIQRIEAERVKYDRMRNN